MLASEGKRMHIGIKIKDSIKNFHPVNLSLVMGVGIVFIDSKLIGLYLASIFLIWVGLASYIVLLFN